MCRVRPDNLAHYSRAAPHRNRCRCRPLFERAEGADHEIRFCPAVVSTCNILAAGSQECDPEISPASLRGAYVGSTSSGGGPELSRRQRR